MSSLNGPWGCRAKRVCVVDTQVLGQCIRGACIAGKPGSYRDLRETLLFCWRFYVWGEPPNIEFGWYSLWFFIKANTTLASLRARITKAWVPLRPRSR